MLGRDSGGRSFSWSLTILGSRSGEVPKVTSLPVNAMTKKTRKMTNPTRARRFLRSWVQNCCSLVCCGGSSNESVKKVCSEAESCTFHPVLHVIRYTLYVIRYSLFVTSYWLVASRIKYYFFCFFLLNSDSWLLTLCPMPFQICNLPAAPCLLALTLCAMRSALCLVKA